MTSHISTSLKRNTWCTSNVFNTSTTLVKILVFYQLASNVFYTADPNFLHIKNAGSKSEFSSSIQSVPKISQQHRLFLSFFCGSLLNVKSSIVHWARLSPLLLLLNASGDFAISFYLVRLNESVHTLFGQELHAWFKFFVHVRSTVHLAKSGRLQWSVRFTPLSELHPAEHLFKSVHGLFECVIRPFYRLAFACARVVIGTSYFVSFSYLFLLIVAKCGFASLSLWGVDVSDESTCVSCRINFHTKLCSANFPNLNKISILCTLVHILRVEVIGSISFYIDSYRLLHYIFIFQVIIGSLL